MDRVVETTHKGHLAKVLFLALAVPIALLLMTANFNDASKTAESSANIYSLLLALLCWGVAGWFLFIRVFGKRFFIILTALILLKIFANYCHFYFVFAPFAGIDSSSELPNADFSGDLGAIFDSAIYFIDTYRDNGLFYAILGDYYRKMNNPGVPIIYGGLFSAFGAYGTVAIPWAVLYSAFGSILIGLIGFAQRLPVKLCRKTILLVFFMPGFFVFPAIYRDNFIVFLLALSAYTAILMPRGNIYFLSIVLFVESILLFSLRMVYLIIPPIFAGITLYFNFGSYFRLTQRKIFFGFIVLITISLAWSYLSAYFDILSVFFAASSDSEQSVFPILSSFHELGPLYFYPAAAIFSLLAPMPWWQSISPTLLSYQIFSYPQTWYSLTVIIALFYSYKKKLVPIGGSVLVVFFLIIFFLALLGSPNFASLYIQIALPLLLLASVRYLSTNWKKCLGISTAIIALVHVVLLTR